MSTARLRFSMTVGIVSIILGWIVASITAFVIGYGQLGFMMLWILAALPLILLVWKIGFYTTARL